MLLSQLEYKRLVDATNLKNLVDNNYLSNVSDENFKWISNQYFDNDETKTKLLASSTGIGKSIVDTISYYTGTPTSEIKDLDLNLFTNDFVTLGYFVIGLKREDGKLKTKYIPAEEFSEENNIYKSFKIYQTPTNNTTLAYNYHILETKYLVGKNENRLYQTTSLASIVIGQPVEVPLNSIYQTEDLQPVEYTLIDRPAVFLIKNDDSKELAYQLSIIKSCAKNIYAMDRKLNMINNQFLQNVESFILMKGIKLPQKTITDYNNGIKLNFNSIGRVLQSDEGGSIEFVNNVNGLLQDAILYEENDLKMISSITKVPVDFLGGTTKEGNIGVGSRSLLHGAFIKLIENIRDKFDIVLGEILELIGKEDDTYTWNDIFAKSDTELVEELKIARESLIISQETAVRKYLGMDKEKTVVELEKINGILETNQKEDADKIGELATGGDTKI